MKIANWMIDKLDRALVDRRRERRRRCNAQKCCGRHRTPVDPSELALSREQVIERFGYDPAISGPDLPPTFGLTREQASLALGFDVVSGEPLAPQVAP
jgi:hypothetical protein